ncbi:MAG TPA: glutathione S-transferase family protein [Parvularculaceae bacterium]|nr:glutathione S-transferase family protein [Parvularculaceae bacterium]HNS87634.1 glutathione S-transferase family protein [Parvularculaceae bacterium]
MIQIIGSPISPYVKKIIVLLNLKHVPFAVDPITPFFGDERFSKLSPLRRIPVFIDSDTVLNDSSVIAQYIEEVWPSPPALGPDPKTRARARWLEEYSDTRIGDAFIWKGFAKMIVEPMVFKTQPDWDAFNRHCDGDVAEIMDFLEAEAPEEGFFCGAFGLADITIAAMFRNMAYVGWTPDAARWPNTRAWLARAEEEPPLALANQWSDRLLKTPIVERRQVAAELGLRLTEETYAEKTPRKGPMSQIG